MLYQEKSGNPGEDGTKRRKSKPEVERFSFEDGRALVALELGQLVVDGLKSFYQTVWA
jgi:hypothetical protein